MSGRIPPFPLMLSWRIQDVFILTFTLTCFIRRCYFYNTNVRTKTYLSADGKITLLDLRPIPSVLHENCSVFTH
jgi:hypothetical protein